MDQVRRREVAWTPSLKGTRWNWLKDQAALTEKQAKRVRAMCRDRLETARAWRIKEALRDLFATRPSREVAEAELRSWFSWARRCRLEPFKRLALTIRDHWQGILNAFESGLSNGAVEGMNGLLQAAKARARGYRTSRTLITMSYLIGGKLAALPANPYDTTSGVRAA